MRGFRTIGATIAVLAVLCDVRVVGAQTTLDSQQVAARRGLLADAQAAAAANNHALAVDLAQRAIQIEMTPSVLLFVAQQQEALGQIAEAMGTADVCVREADRNTAIRNRDAILAQCRQYVAQLTPRLGRLIVRVPSPAPAGLIVRVNGTILNPAFYGTGYRVTPGNIAVDASTEGHAAWHRDVAVAAGASVDVDATGAGNTARTDSLVASTSPSHDRTATSVATTNRDRTSHPSAQSAGNSANSGTSVAPFIVMGVGALGLIAAGVLYYLRVSTLDSLHRNYCDPVPQGWACSNDDHARSQFSSAQLFDTSSLIAVSAGGVVLVAGVVYWFVSRRAHQERPNLSFYIDPTRGGAMFGIGGSL